MNAIVATQYGSLEVLQLREVENLSQKTIKVHATTVNAGGQKNVK